MKTRLILILCLLLLYTQLLFVKGYPEDEAATYDILNYRHTEAPELNRGCFHGDELIGVRIMLFLIFQLEQLKDIDFFGFFYCVLTADDGHFSSLGYLILYNMKSDVTKYVSLEHVLKFP